MGNKKILVIDDDENIAKLVKLNLEKNKKYEVRIESRGAHGLAVAKQFRPDLILLDIMMPDMEGGEVASGLKGDDDTRDIPIVFLTSLVREEELHHGGQVIGGHPFLAKPIVVAELIDVIEKNIGK